ncbi:hypothetical protein vseg_005437 [Gypsophila vaccaria]
MQVKSNSSGVDLPTQVINAKTNCLAVVRTNENERVFGSKALSNVYHPITHPNQWSAARIKLSNGPESIEAGWMVNPTFFKDNEAHLYAKYKSATTECLNTVCAGFVEQSTDITLGSAPEGYSVVKGVQLMWQISIDKHQDDGNWWLSVVLPNRSVVQIGYWPATLFISLKDFAIQAEWGGEIYASEATDPPPAMGSGLKATIDQTLSAFFQQISVVDENFNRVNPGRAEEYANCPNLYTVIDAGNLGDNLDRVIFYGGM